jgi:hypothetical protein
MRYPRRSNSNLVLLPELQIVNYRLLLLPKCAVHSCQPHCKYTVLVLALQPNTSNLLLTRRLIRHILNMRLVRNTPLRSLPARRTLSNIINSKMVGYSIFEQSIKTGFATLGLPGFRPARRKHFFDLLECLVGGLRVREIELRGGHEAHQTEDDEHGVADVHESGWDVQT